MQALSQSIRISLQQCLSPNCTFNFAAHNRCCPHNKLFFVNRIHQLFIDYANRAYLFIYIHTPSPFQKLLKELDIFLSKTVRFSLRSTDEIERILIAFRICIAYFDKLVYILTKCIEFLIVLAKLTIDSIIKFIIEFAILYFKNNSQRQA